MITTTYKSELTENSTNKLTIKSDKGKVTLPHVVNCVDAATSRKVKSAIAKLGYTVSTMKSSRKFEDMPYHVYSDMPRSELLQLAELADYRNHKVSESIHDLLQTAYNEIKTRNEWSQWISEGKTVHHMTERETSLAASATSHILAAFYAMGLDYYPTSR